MLTDKSVLLTLILSQQSSESSDLEWYCYGDGNALQSNFRILSQKARLILGAERVTRGPVIKVFSMMEQRVTVEAFLLGYIRRLSPLPLQPLLWNTTPAD